MNYNALKTKILSYENSRFLEFLDSEANFSKLGIPPQELFLELKKFLYVIYCWQLRHWPENTSFILTDELDLIDQVWHTFILLTKDYYDFCFSNFGDLIHHSPISTNNKNQGVDLKKVVLEQILFVNETWGENTVVKWYKEFPEKYLMLRPGARHEN